MYTINSSMEISALGRPMSLGDLYNARSDRVEPGQLWTTEVIQQFTDTAPKPHTHYTVESSESLSQKMDVLDVDASVKASFCGGLIEVGGSAQYLLDKTSSAQDSRVTLNYSVTTIRKDLNINAIPTPDRKIFSRMEATHVVVGVTYGANAIMEFHERATENSQKQDIKANMNVMIKKIPTVTVSGSAGINISSDVKDKVKNYTCKFYGDFQLREIPSTYEMAVKVYQELPSLLGENNENVIPVKVTLYPLSKYTTESKLKNMISVQIVNDLGKALDDLHQAKVKVRDLEKSSKKMKTEDITKKLQKFQGSLNVFTTEFKSKMKQLIPDIRGGNGDESALKDLLKSQDTSGFSGSEMMKWLTGKEDEITIITLNTKNIQEENFKTKHDLERSYLMGSDVTDAFVLCFTSLGDAEPYLQKISSRGTQGQEVLGQEVHPWYDRPNVRKMLKDSVETFNKAPIKTRIVSFISDPKNPGASVRWYHDGQLKDPNVKCILDAFACNLTLDKNTANHYVVLSEDERRVTYTDTAQERSFNPKRFDHKNCQQVLCKEPLPAGRSYWECEWSGGDVYIGVAQETMERKSYYAWIGLNDESWSLRCYGDCYYFYHNYGNYENLPAPPPGTRKLGLFLDRDANTLAFYVIDNDTHKSTPWFTKEGSFSEEDIYAGLGRVGHNASVSLI